MKLTLRDELIKKWSILSENLEEDLDKFAEKLFEKGIISMGARRKKSYGAMMDTFIASMNVCDTVEQLDDHCSKLLDILDDIGGAASRIGASLGMSWRTAVKNKYGIDFLINYGKHWTEIIRPYQFNNLVLRIALSNFF